MTDFLEKLETEEDYEKLLEHIFSSDSAVITDEKIMEALNLYFTNQ